MRHAKAGIFPFADGDGVVKAAPEATVGGLDFVGRRHGEVVERHNL